MSSGTGSATSQKEGMAFVIVRERDGPECGPDPASGAPAHMSFKNGIL